MPGIEYTAPPQSRNESILAATLGGTEYTAPPQSRIEDLLIQLKEAIEQGGGGDTTALVTRINAIEAQLFSTIADVETNTDTGSMDLYSKDLNTITTSGFYNAMTCTNAPSNYCTLIVIGYYLAGYCTQIAADVTTGKMYMRSQVNGTWGTWGEKLSAADLAAVATSGSYSDLSNKPTIDTAITENSANAVTSAAIYAANEIQNSDIADATKAIVGNYTLYVNGTTGSDNNSGTSSGEAFATIEKAVTEACKYRSAIINIAAGEYTLAAGSIEIRGVYSLSIRGAGADSTIINGRFSADRGAYVNFTNLSINSTTDTTSNGGIFGFESAQIYLNSVNVSASTGACVNISSGTMFYAISCKFGGTPSYTVRSGSGARAIVRTCTGISGVNARADVSGELRLDQCTDMTYTSATQGIVFVNGLQVLPTA